MLHIRNKNKIILNCLFIICFINSITLLIANETDTTLIRINKIQIDSTKIQEMNDYAWKLKSAEPYKSTVIAEKNLLYSQKINYLFGQAISFNTLGAINLLQANYQIALENYQSSIKINKLIKNLDGISRNYNNIAIIFNKQKNYDKSLEYHLKALGINLKLKNDELIANSYNNLGNIFSNKLDYTKSLEYHYKSLEINQKIKDLDGIGRNYGNIGLVYQKLKDYSKAIEIIKKAVNICENLEDDLNLTINYINLGELYKLTNNYQLALNYLKQAEEKSKKMCAKHLIMDSYKNLFELYEKSKNYKMAFEFQKKYSVISDSVFSEEKALELGKVEGKYELELQLERKKQTEKELLQKENEEIQRRSNLQYSAIFIFIFLTFLSVFVLGKLVTSDRTIEAMIFLSFLILFEFLLVLIDPVIDIYSNGLPLFNLSVNIGLALLIFPLHHFFETKLKEIVNRNIKNKLDKNT